MFPRGNRTWKKLAAGVPGPCEGPSLSVGPPLSYLNSPVAVPPGDLVRSVAGEGDVLFPVNALRCFLSGFGELEKIKYSRQLLRWPVSDFGCDASPPGLSGAGH